MSFLTGSTKEMYPGTLQKFRDQGMLPWLQKRGLDTGLFGAGDVDLEPYRKMFAQQTKEALASAKEQSGNLTGSGFANIMGATAGRSATAQGAALADIRRIEKARTAQNFMQMLGIGTGMQGQMAYQPGFLDYLFQGAAAAVPLVGPQGLGLIGPRGRT